jgi:hypothetical protein
MGVGGEGEGLFEVETGGMVWCFWIVSLVTFGRIDHIEFGSSHRIFLNRSNDLND